MSLFTAIIGASKAADYPPDLPSFTGTVSTWGLYNWNPSGYVGGATFADDSAEAHFLSTAPYAVDYTDFILGSDPPPYLIQLWNDQSATSNDLTSTGSARPILQVTTAVVVASAGTAAANGVYTLRGTFHDKPYYNLSGEPDDIAKNSIGWESYNDDEWDLIVGEALGYSSADDTAYPFQATFTNPNTPTGDPAPTVTASANGTGQIQFDGVACGMAGANPLYP